MPIAVTHAGFAVDGGTVWMAGGFEGDHPGRTVRDVWKYDLATDKWEPGPPLPDERASAGLALLGRELHFIGGLKKDRQTDSGDHWVLSLDGGGEWTPRAPMPVPRNHMAIVALDGQIYALGGVYGHDGVAGDLAVAHAYDPQTDSWREIAPLRQPRSHFEPGTFIADGRIVIVGGRSEAQEVLYDITAYDPVRDEWQDLPSLPVPLRAPVAKLIGNEVISGQGGSMPTGDAPRDEMIRWTWKPLDSEGTVPQP
jgi:N-acetylneuraminic acid mutarotase